MGGLKTIFNGMAQIVGQAELALAGKINATAGNEWEQGVDAGDITAGGDATGAGVDGTGAGVGGEPGDASAEGNLSTQQLLALQYDVQRFSIFNNMATSTMQSVAGAYQSVTGNLNFR